MNPVSTHVLIALVGLILVPITSTQDRAPGQAEYELLASIAGEYTYEYTEVGSPTQTGKIVFELFEGGRFLRFDESGRSPQGGPMHIMGIIGYDAIRGYFTWYRAFDNGAYDRAQGTLDDGTITFNIVESRTEQFGENSWSGPGVRLRTKWTGFNEGGLKTFIWERSVNEGPWELLSEGRSTRVR